MLFRVHHPYCVTDYTSRTSKTGTFIKCLESLVNLLLFTTVNPAGWIPKFNSDLNDAYEKT